MSKLIPAGRRIPAWKEHGGFISWEPTDNVTPVEAMIAAGLDTPVTTHTIYDSTLTPIPRKVETRRDGKHMAIVGKDTYHVRTWQEELLPIITGLTFESDVSVVAAGKYHDGAKELMALQWPENVTVAGQEFQGFLWATNSHDGSSSSNLGLYKLRPSCTNMVPTFNGKAQIKIRHRSNSGIDVEAARSILEVALAYDKQFAFHVDTEINTPFAEASFEEFVEKQFAPLTLPDGTKKQGRGLTMALNAQDAMWDSYRADDLSDVRGTLFQATQAVYAYYDWAYSSDKGRSTRTLDNTTANLKVQARESLYALV